jgi:hypothetical protein
MNIINPLSPIGPYLADLFQFLPQPALLLLASARRCCRVQRIPLATQHELHAGQPEYACAQVSVEPTQRVEVGPQGPLSLVQSAGQRAEICSNIYARSMEEQEKSDT